ncbi:virulence factor TspB C-terminal domain-related protein [Acinetobacter sp.]|uniref:virulence factor TspB C-terminal domain-related protein n=2 Tax=Acinetobacter sp. TaxID=472 RepID=UPI003D092E0F
MMKFFKYLIFISLSLFSVSALAANYKWDNGILSATGTESTICQNIANALGSKTFRPWKQSQGADFIKCTLERDNGGGTWSSMWEGNANLTADECSPQSIKSKPITVVGWTNWTLDQQDAYTAKIKGQTACYNGCKYKDPIIAGESDNQFKISFANPVKDSSCPATSDLPDTPYPDNVTPPADGCKSGEAYCDKPPTGCPTGYTSGSFNGKQICVKNNPDPTKPNPNDPNNNPNNSKFDDSKIIAAINASKDAITSSINNAVNSINSSISSINQSITTVANAVNGTTNAVNNNTAATNAVKSSVDALHNTINAVTTAVNNNTSAVTSAVNSNTSATNAVKASVDALNSTVSAVTSAVDKNTTAVNANGDKVANAVKDNITATNAVKDAVSNLNSSINAVSDAVNANGKNTLDAVNNNGKNTVDAVNSVKSAIDSLNNSVNAVTSAVNANGDKVSNSVNTNGDKITNAVNKGTEATKENGKKLDQIAKGQEEGNSLLKDIKDWLTQENNLPENEKPEIEEYDVGDYEKSYVSWSASCPPDVQIPISLMGQSSTLVLKWSPWCELLSKIRWAIIACAYFSAAYIILGMRG